MRDLEEGDGGNASEECNKQKKLYYSLEEKVDNASSYLHLMPNTVKR